MQRYCIDKQKESYNKLSQIYLSYSQDSEEVNIIRCMNKWRGEVSGHDYRMVLYCTEKQIEAYNSLK
jgi:hypothetical protein